MNIRLCRTVLSTFTLACAFVLFPAPGVRAEEPNLITAIEKVSELVGPTVVSIVVEKTERYRAYQFYGSPLHDEFMQRFFEDFFGAPQEQELKRSGLGSGVIIDKRGFILTNNHVIGDADKITVTLSDGRKFKATVKGADPRSDLAVIQIEAPDLPAARLGDSDSLKIGQWVVAIGNPFGHILAAPEPTVTTGVISALHRTLPQGKNRDSDYSDLIQTDAAINPGNSGGPLVNLNGEVIGINVAIFSTSGGYQGIGFAIPANHAKKIMEQLIEGKKVTYGWIGVSIQDMDYRLAQYFGLSAAEGVVVVKVLAGGPADRSGLKEGDIVLSVDGKSVSNIGMLLHRVGNTSVGEKISLKVQRDNKQIDIPITIAPRPAFDEFGQLTEDETQPEESPAEPAQELNEWRGLKVTPITDDIANQLGLANTNGVVIIAVAPNSPADEAGLRKGNVIIAINKNTIVDMKDFTKIAGKAKGTCLVRTIRGYSVIEEK